MRRIRALVRLAPLSLSVIVASCSIPAEPVPSTGIVTDPPVRDGAATNADPAVIDVAPGGSLSLALRGGDRHHFGTDDHESNGRAR